jgi:hypothetical protein
MICVKESRKVVLIDTNGAVNETTLNDTINAFTDNYNAFMRAHKNIMITLNNLYYAIQK